MDPEIAALAAAGAQAIVTLVATEAWGSVRESVVRAFARRGDASAQGVDGELQRSRDLILAAGSSGDSSAREREQAGWDARLRLLMLENPEVVPMINELIRSLRIVPVSSSGRISMRAEASGQARVYQQGHGTQYNS